MRTILLTKGAVAIVDDCDYTKVSSFKWSVAERRGTRYAANGKVGLLHRFILGCSKLQLVDHKDGNGLDNRRANLRVASRSQNAMNMKKDALKGITPDIDGQRWKAQITIDGKTLYLGIFASPEDAALQYDQAAYRYFGEFASVNYPDISMDTDWKCKVRSGSSAHKGISFNKSIKAKPWIARKYIAGKSFRIGSFKTEQEAVEAYGQFVAGGCAHV